MLSKNRTLAVPSINEARCRNSSAVHCFTRGYDIACRVQENWDNATFRWRTVAGRL